MQGKKTGWLPRTGQKRRRKMKTMITLLAVLGMVLALAPAAQAAEIYSDDFTGSAGDLSGTGPGWTAATGAGSWQLDGSGKATTGGGRRFNWLAFTPTSGIEYTLSMDVDVTSASWIGIFFATDSSTPGVAPVDGTALFTTDTYAWMLRDQTSVQNFTGLGTAGAVSTPIAAGITNLKIVLNTQASTWTAEYIVGGTSIRGPVALPVGATTDIRWVGFGNDAATGTVDNFLLTSAGALPPDLKIADNSVSENVADAAAGSLYVINTNTTFTYSLVSGTGDEGNDFFKLSPAGGGSNNSNLLTAVALDYEITNSYSIRVLAEEDGGGLSLTNTFTISIDNVVEPFGTYASASVTPETTEVGTLESVMGDNTTVTYTIPGTEFDDAKFKITGGNVLELINAADSTGKLGTSYFVNVVATGDQDAKTNSLLIKVTVENSATAGTIFVIE
jgi:hypothetical protein